jgi:hypothetical protein
MAKSIQKIPADFASAVALQRRLNGNAYLVAFESLVVAKFCEPLPSATHW